ncbi:SDR family NAD(P)-dependent oxidoreductase [Heyndrickxia acidiproducens]|uniref:SDR family NAD(P)-dependent oxidoreductase n=1 Tax=Heyndrickxia acidiproducens TaxID=1121084 RepID=UPI00037B2C60|nr:SDR family NAD(P)-dependent oxidoreductase [Heyndrickxia acidiproducens]
MTKLQGKTALITGGSRGLGAAMAVTFAEEGAENLILGDVLLEESNETARKIKEQFGTNVLPVQLDVSSEEDWVHIMETIRKTFGKLDILVNNAGINKRAKFADCELEDWNRVIAVNQTGVFLGIKHACQLLKEQKQSAIVNVSSIAGLTGYFAVPYTASKWAIRGMTKAAAMEFGDWGIRVNSVHPGFVYTPLTQAASKMVDAFSEITALERSGEPEEIAKAVAFLASDDASYITGAELAVDGGMIAGGGPRRVVKNLNLL